jgi:DNA helicase-2/ATP-dependent DNA helicase PcrA
MALIGRKRSQIIPYQIVFAGDGIPFCAAEDLNVLLGDAFEQLKAILLLKAQASQPLPFGPDPVEGLLKMCDKVKRYPLSKADRGKLRGHLASSRPRTIVQALEALYDYEGSLKGRNAGGQMAASFYAAIKRLLATHSVAEAMRVISTDFDGLQKDYGKSLDDVFYTDPPFLYLAELAERYGDDFGRFYEDVESAIASLAAILAEDDDEAHPHWKRDLHLMTALRAKGKEFDDVFILDCNQGIWPSRLAQTEEELEAERRLFYVAMTRARRSLTLLVNERMFGEVAVTTQYFQEMGLTAQAP